MEDEKHYATIMNPIDFFDLVSGKNGKSCIVETKARAYEGIYLHQRPEGGLRMVIRPTGTTKEYLTNIGCAENPLCDPSKECAIPVDQITRIEFNL